MVEQLSSFAENAKGSLLKITQALLDHNINMNTLITNDSAEFGIIRMLVSDAHAAEQALKQAGYICRVDQVLAIEIGDECGCLNRLLKIISAGNINVEYVYVTYTSFSKHPVTILKTFDMYEVNDFLISKGYSSLNTIEQ